MRFNCFINKSSSKTKARTIKGSAIVKSHVDAKMSKNGKNDLIVKNHVDACTNTEERYRKGTYWKDKY